MSAEPTAEQREHTIRGVLAFGRGGGYSDEATARTIALYVAEQVAAAVTAEREKYLRVADELWKLGDSLAADAMTVDDNNGADLHYAARRIREVSS